MRIIYESYVVVAQSVTVEKVLHFTKNLDFFLFFDKIESLKQWRN